MQNRIIDRKRDLISVIGRLKIGEKVKNGNGVEYPKSRDYFIPKGEFAENFTKIYGEKPKKLLIFFPNDDAVTQQYTIYYAGALYGKSDGLTVEYVDGKEKKSIQFNSTDEANNFMDEYAEKINKLGKQKSKAEWKESVKLFFMLAELRNVMGLWSFETQGKESMVNQLANSYDDAKKLLGIVGVPFWLSVEMVEHFSAKEQRKQIFPVVSLSPAIGFGQLLELKTGAKSVPELIDNTIKMLMPPPVKNEALKKLPGCKTKQECLALFESYPELKDDDETKKAFRKHSETLK